MAPEAWVPVASRFELRLRSVSSSATNSSIATSDNVPPRDCDSSTPTPMNEQLSSTIQFCAHDSLDDSRARRRRS